MASSDYEQSFPELIRLATHVAARIVRVPEDAADIGVETMARAYQRWARIDGYAPQWVVRTASNLAIDHQRRRPTPPMSSPIPTAAVEDEVVSNEVIGAMLRRLTRRQREAIVLTVLCGYTADQAAEILRISPSSVKTHAHRGLVSLRRAHVLDEQETRPWLTTI